MASRVYVLGSKNDPILSYCHAYGHTSLSRSTETVIWDWAVADDLQHNWDPSHDVMMIMMIIFDLAPP
jgi:hypothetical protein